MSIQRLVHKCSSQLYLWWNKCKLETTWCPSMGEERNKFWCIHTIDYYSVIKWNKLFIYATRIKNLILQISNTPLLELWIIELFFFICGHRLPRSQHLNLNVCQTSKNKDFFYKTPRIYNGPILIYSLVSVKLTTPFP